MIIPVCKLLGSTIRVGWTVNLRMQRQINWGRSKDNRSGVRRLQIDCSDWRGARSEVWGVRYEEWGIRREGLAVRYEEARPHPRLTSGISKLNLDCQADIFPGVNIQSSKTPYVQNCTRSLERRPCGPSCCKADHHLP